MKPQPLPNYQKIEINDILPASTLLFYGGNKATEFYGNHRYHHQYTPPAFHAAFYLETGLQLSVGKFKVIKIVEEEFRSTRRVDVIMYPTIPEDVRKKVLHDAYLDADDPKLGLNLPTYGFFDFLRFEPLLQWLPKSKHDICSENVYKRFLAEGVTVANKPSKTEVAPWMLLEYALANPSRCQIRTLWIGKDFKTL